MRKASSIPRPARQRRGRETLERIVAAAEAIMAEDGPGATTVTAVMARAKVGPGSFYARFDGKESLVRLIQSRFMEGCLAGVEDLARIGAWTDVPVPVRAGEAVRRLVRGHVSHEASLRAVLAEAIRRPGGEEMERVVEMDETLLEAVTGALDPEGHHQGALRVAFLQVLGALRALVLFPDESPLAPGFSEEDLILEFLRTVLAALGRIEEAPATYADLLRRSAAIVPSNAPA